MIVVFSVCAKFNITKTIMDERNNGRNKKKFMCLLEREEIYLNTQIY